MILALVLIGAIQALAKPPIIILPSILDSQLLADYDQAKDPGKACQKEKLTAAKMWPPPIDDLLYFLDTFAPVLPEPTCWWHMMQLSNTTQSGRFVDNSGLKITASLSLSASLVLPPLGAAIRNATGYNTSQITVLAYGDPSAAAAAASSWQQQPSLQNTHTHTA